MVDVNLYGVSGARTRRDREHRIDARQICNKPQKQAFCNAADAEMHHLTRSLAAEWATRGARVNALAPTGIDMPLTRYECRTGPRMTRGWR